MALAHRTNINRTLRGVEMDVRDVKLFGADLQRHINEQVRDSQTIIITELPAWLNVSHKQFVSLLDYTSEMHDTRDRMFLTPYNVMEVVVDESLDTVYDGDIENLTTDPIEASLLNEDNHEIQEGEVVS